MKAVFRDLMRAARSSFPILLVGETGTGKSTLAAWAHSHSRVASAKLVTADCGCITDTLVETELFGHVRGAFTGATENKDGFLAVAHGGTLLLDGIQLASPRLQACLLRAIESGEYRPVGRGGTQHSEFRLISTASPGIWSAVETGEMRQDLYYRIGTLVVTIPPLRGRVEDISRLAEEEAGRLGVVVDRAAMSVLERHDWPGNVRQLVQCVRHAAVLSDDGIVGIDRVLVALGGERHSGGLGGAAGCRLGEARSEEPLWKQLRDAGLSQFGTSELSGLLGISRRSAQRRLGEMVKAGQIRRTGAGRATRYTLSAE